MNKPKGRVFPPVSQEEYDREFQSRKRINEISDFLGIRTIFDNRSILTEDMEKQYEKDSSYALALLLGGKEVPKDVQERLLRIKKLREEVKKKQGI